MAIRDESSPLRVCFIHAAVLLLFCLALLSSFVQIAQAIEVNSHRMAIGIRPDGTRDEGNIYFKGGWSIAEFSSEDEQAYVWMNVTLDEGTTIMARWLFPNGSVYQLDEETRGEGLNYVWFSIKVKDYQPARVLGKWYVEIFVGDTRLFTEEFLISQAPTFPWDTTLRFMGIIVVAIVVPALLVFSRMKKPPPKLSFALSLVGGVMIAVSGFFRGALGGELYVYASAFAMAILIFGIAAGLFFGMAIAICSLTRKRVLVVILSVISLVYFVGIYGSWMSEDPRLYVLPLSLVVIGSVCSILGGLLMKRKT